MKIFWDVETVPLPDAELKALMPKFDPAEVKLGNVKDPDKIIAKLNEAKASMEKDFIENAALSAHTGRVAAIGTMMDGDFIFAGGDEREIITEFWETVNESMGTANLMIGFNIFDFDLPFLIRRSWKLKIKIPSHVVAGSRYPQWHLIFIDLRQKWLMGERSPEKGTSSLDALARYFGLPPKKGNGKDFSNMDPKQRMEYLRQDVSLVAQIWERIGYEGY